MKLVPGQGIFTLNVSYIARAPSNRQVDLDLRDCMASAIRRDGSKDILANAWLRKRAGADPNDDDMLNPYGILTNLIYESRTKTMQVKKMTLQRK